MRKLPDLTFPMIDYGKMESPWDLRPLLYKGGAAANVRKVADLIVAGQLGRPITARVELLIGVHEVLIARLIGGGSKTTAFNKINGLRHFYSWADEAGFQLTLQSVESMFRLWADTLADRVRLRQIKENTAYGVAATVASILDVLSERGAPLIQTTRLRFRAPSPRAAGGVENDKQNLAKTFAFGHLLLDVIEGLSGTAIWASLPVKIPLRTGKVLAEWSHLRDPENCVVLQQGYPEKANTRKIIAAREAWSNDNTLRTRYPLANMKIEAELLVFISQTGMNLAQANKLKLYQFSFKSSIDGYEVRDYKHRRRGEVLFEIFAEYKLVFENYLAWRKNVFPDAQELFPFVRQGGRAALTPPNFHKLKSICEEVGIAFFGPKSLRKTRVNWLLRESRDLTFTAEQAQHTKETLLRVYEQPSMQVAMQEIVQFWPGIDPSLNSEQQSCLVAGTCDGIPEPTPNSPDGAPKPDCVHPAGCLFCDKHRDIDSEDYVWSMTSMHYLKKLVLKGYRSPIGVKDNPVRHVELTLEMLITKLKWFSCSNEIRAGWVLEATERVDEGDYHPHWRILIESAEVV